jgi:hypothetical protein
VSNRPRVDSGPGSEDYGATWTTQVLFSRSSPEWSWAMAHPCIMKVGYHRGALAAWQRRKTSGRPLSRPSFARFFAVCNWASTTYHEPGRDYYDRWHAERARHRPCTCSSAKGTAWILEPAV